MSSAARTLTFRDLPGDIEPQPLAVSGRIPDWLRGSFFRNGPAQWHAGGAAMNHWFDGMGFIQRFEIAGGAVTYAGRFVQSQAYRAFREGQVAFREFGTDPPRRPLWRVRRLLSQGQTDNTNVNILPFGDSLVALTEVLHPQRIDPVTLETLGLYRYNDDLPNTVTTAHPGRAGREIVNYAVEFGVRSFYHVFALDPATAARRRLAKIAVDRPAYMHSFGLSERYLILVEFPLVTEALALLLSSKPFIGNYEWSPERGSRFHLIDLSGSEPVTTALGEPFFAFHHIAAHDDGREIIVELIGYDDAGIVGQLSLETLLTGAPVVAGGSVRRYRIPKAGGDVRRETVVTLEAELPRYNFERPGGGLPRFVYATGFGCADQFSNRLVRIDMTTGAVATWERPRQSPGEPVFVARPGASAEDDGVLLSVVLDLEAARSSLVLLDPRSFEEIGRATAGIALPVGFHGNFLR